MKIKKIKIIKNKFETSEAKVDQCSLCDLNGFCMEIDDFDCEMNVYYTLKNQRTQLIKYEVEVVNDDIE